MENKGLVIRTYLILMLVTGILMSVLIPHWQTPDENAHLNMIGISLRNEKMAELLGKDMPMDANRIRYQYDQKLNIREWEKAMTQMPSYERSVCTPKGIRLSVIKHLPAAIGIAVGTWLYLPTFWVMQLAELFSLVVYVGICGLVLKIMPIKKEVMMLIMVFPMTLQQAASINYDSVLLPLSFLYIAYIFYIWCEKESLVWKDVGIIVLLLIWISYIKIPYIILGLLVFVVPKEKIHLKIGSGEINEGFIQKWKVVLGIAGIFLVIGAIYLMRENPYFQLLPGMLLEWRRTLYLMKATIMECGKYLLVSSVGQFGYLDSALPFVFVIVSYLLMLVVSVDDVEKEQIKLAKRTKIYVWIVFIILYVFTVVSMVNHTITVVCFGAETGDINYNIREMLYRISYIGGLQGRYFLPFIVLPFLVLPTKGKEKKYKLWTIPIYQIVMMGVTIVTLYKRYWIG